MQPITQHGRQFLLLRDPLQLTENQLLIPRQLAPALGLCDGQRSIAQICTLFTRRSGIPLQSSQLNQMLQALDDAYMLENQRYESMLVEAKRIFRSASCRQPALADRSYPSNPRALKRQLDEYLINLPKSIPERSTKVRATASQPMARNHGSIRRGLVSPHIDYMRGGPVYAQVWKEAEAAAQAADLVVMFGTDHSGTDPFTLTQQSYATPYGILPTPSPIVDALAAAVDGQLGDGAAYAGELRHRGEHSLELVAVWLHHMRQGKPCNLVPILVGGFHSYIQDVSDPQDDPLYNAVFETLHRELKLAKANGKNVFVVASGDLAHVGPAFGGAALDSKSRQKLRADDERLITQVQAGNAEAFFEEIRDIEDGNNVCGVSPIYLTMKLLELMDGSISGQLTGYETCPADDSNTSVVTIGGIVFE